MPQESYLAALTRQPYADASILGRDKIHSRAGYRAGDHLDTRRIVK